MRLLLATFTMLVVAAAPAAAATAPTCASFATQQAAQDYVDAHGNAARLDSDGDGLACEELVAVAPTSTTMAGEVVGAPNLLPFTGAKVGLLGVIGLSVLGLGLLALRASRDQPRHERDKRSAP